MTAFTWTASAFTHILYDMLNPEKGTMVATFLGPNKVPEWFRAGTNGKRVFIVAERFFCLPLLQQIFLLAHEVGHPACGHIIAAAYYRQKGFIEVGMKKFPFNDMLANFAQDYVLNDMLIESRIGEFIEGGCWDKTIGTYKDSWIDVYEKLYHECEKQRGKTQDGDGKPVDPDKGDDGKSDDGKGPPTRKDPKGRPQHVMDAHMEFGSGEPDPNNPGGSDDADTVDLDGPPMNEATYQDEMRKTQQAVASAMELARQRGTLPAAFEMMCQKVLEPVVDWTEHVRSLLARKLGSGGYDYRRPDRRLIVRDIIVPGRSGYGANVVIVGADSSGSIHAVPLLVDRWMGECGGMMEDVRPREIHVVWCDAKSQRVDILTDPSDVAAMVVRGSKGGGGTDFRPVFQYAAELNQEIDCMVYLTDGDGTFPKHAPKFPVVWGDISGDPSKYPFGDVVNIPVPRR